MIVCQCKGVTDRDIRALVRRGCDTVGSVGRRCGAGTDCGGCIATIRAVIQHEKLLMECEASHEDATLVTSPAPGAGQ